MDSFDYGRELLTLSEVANVTRVSVAVLLGEIRDGRLGAYRVRSRWMCSHGQIESWLKRVEKPATLDG